ncbi:MAG: SAM-dependent methyltransferase, partial [Bacteroidetes bacterium]
HVPNINDFVGGIAALLKPLGTCTLEVPYLPNLLKFNEFDTIYHEHFFYFSLAALRNVMAAHCLQICHAEQINIHGGSLRIYVKHAHCMEPMSAELQALIHSEDEMGIDTPSFYAALQQNALAIKTGFLQWLHQQLAAGKSIMCYGAAAKGNTFLNYCGITTTHIKYVADVTPPKQGLYLPGSHISIVAEERLKQEKPDFIVVLPWNFKQEINERLRFTREWGAQLVYFIPEFEVAVP